MKKIMLLTSAALFAASVSTTASAGECDGYYEYAALKCGWKWGDYNVKGFDTTAYDYFSEPERGSSCLGALNDFTGAAAAGHLSCETHSSWYLEESTGNALTDTHLLKRCVTNIC